MTNDKDSAVHGCEEPTLAEQLTIAIDDRDWELSAFVRENADAILTALRQPTQSDALLEYCGGYHNASGEPLERFIIPAPKPDPLVEENERLRERLRITLQFALAYAEGTGDSFDYAMTLAQDELDDLRAQEASNAGR